MPKTEPVEELNFKVPDLDTLLANLIGNDTASAKVVEPKEEIKEAKIEPVAEEKKQVSEIAVEPKFEKVKIKEEPKVIEPEPVVPLKEEPVISNDIFENNDEVLLETPKPAVGGNLRDMLYNPVNANVNTNGANENNKFISTPSISEIKNNAETKQYIEDKKIENEVIKSEDKPIINIKLEEIKSDNNTISDDEFFDDFFGD